MFTSRMIEIYTVCYKHVTVVEAWWAAPDIRNAYVRRAAAIIASPFCSLVEAGRAHLEKCLCNTANWQALAPTWKLKSPALKVGLNPGPLSDSSAI